MTVFRNLDPEGEWQLFIADKARGDSGGLAGS